MDLYRPADASAGALRKEPPSGGSLPPSGCDLVPEDTAQTIHQLRVDLLTLEMQNEELRESLAQVAAAVTRYTDHYNFAPVGYLSLTSNGTITQTNLAGARLLGEPRTDLPGQRLGDFVAAADIPLLNTFLTRVFESTTNEICEVAFQHEDGTRICVHIEATSSANHRECRVAMVDITDRKRAEEALRESESRFRSLVETAPEGIMVQSEGRFVFVNPAVQRLLGASLPDDLLGMAFMSRIAPEYVDIVHQRIQHQRETSRPAPLMELEFLRLDGSRVAVETTAVHVRFQGRDAHLVFVRDITARKLAEAERERLMAAVEQSGETIVITNAEGLIQFVNPAFVTVTGYARGEVVGKKPSILKSGRQSEAFYQELWGTVSRGRTWQGRMVNKRKDGTLYTEEATISPVRDKTGQITNYVAIKRDITAHLNLESQFRQAQKMESVGRLAGGVAHDFNNLLMGIMGCAELCREHVGADHPIGPWLDEILAAAERSAAITRQLLAFARKQTIAPVVLDVNEAVAGMLKLLRRLLGEDIDLDWKPGPGIMSVKMDPSQIDQVLANLTVNARDAINGVGKLSIATEVVTLGDNAIAEHPGSSPGTFVMLAVSDTGCGMDKETLEHIFEPFFTTRGVGQGTGLGLATLYGIVNQNSGFVNVTSTPEQGTTFRVYLPQWPEEAAAAETQAPPCPGGTETVLLVEDEKSIRVTARALLEGLGYTVLTAEAPEPALRLVAAHDRDIHLLITDVVMPGMNGHDLALRLATLRPTMRCLYMSGYTADVIAHRGVLDQDVNFLPKPFTRTELARTIRDVLDKA
ncbi:MAG: PAS domain S-box protein [Lentisphaerae bacterium]|nr:PAS domain S-box protein [Lentisphaerota bacterium]